MCGANPSVEPLGVHVQLTHRTIAVLLVLHLIGVVMMLRKRRASEAPVVVRAAYVALGMVLLQLVVASSMILLHLPPVLRSLHEATGVGIWLSCFVLAYLARRASQVGGSEAAALEPTPVAPAPPIVPTPLGSPLPSSSLGQTGSASGISTASAPLTAAPIARATEVLVGNSAFVYEPAEEAPLLSDPALESLELSPIVEQPPAAETVAPATIESSSATEAVVAEAGSSEASGSEVAASELHVDSLAEKATVDEIVVEPAQASHAADMPAIEAIGAQSNGDESLQVSEQIEFGGAPRANAADSANPTPLADLQQPPVVAPVVTPLPVRPKHTMAVIIARGADL
jgi:hypothetical protein